jgi:hypothetical protein
MLGLWLSVSAALLIALFGRGGVGESIAGWLFACLAQDCTGLQKWAGLGCNCTSVGIMAIAHS